MKTSFSDNFTSIVSFVWNIFNDPKFSFEELRNSGILLNSKKNGFMQICKIYWEIKKVISLKLN